MDINNIQSSVQSMTSGFVPNSLSDKKSLETSNVEQNSVTPAVPKALEKATNQTPENTATPANVDSLLSGLNEQLQTLQSFLKFEKDEDNQKMVFFIKNTETGETIRQIPNKELLTISKNISNYLEAVQQSSDLTGKSPSPVGLLTSQMA